MTWRDDAFCRGKPLPFQAHAPNRAKRLCAQCDVRMQCLEAAISEEWGAPRDTYRYLVRGGLTGEERYEAEQDLRLAGWSEPKVVRLDSLRGKWSR